MTEYVFIVGSPRSGTTILGTVLNEHPALDHWYEPVFVVDRHFQHYGNDYRTIDDATPKIINDIQSAYTYYQQKRNSQIIVDKNPLNSFKVAFLHKIFPNAKFLHILRDGRDVTRSLHIEWQQRIQVLESNNPFRFLNSLKRYIDRQPLLRHKLEATLFEIGDPRNLFRGKQYISYRTRRWRGYKGYGPQFKGWEDVIETASTIQFNAMQWKACVSAIMEDCHNIPTANFYEIRYEEFITNPVTTLESVFAFMEIDPLDNLEYLLPPINASNHNKWSSMSDEEKQSIGDILNPLLMQLGYATDDSWYK